ncbi:hypothetical protein [Minwuia sp.]|uniref:hypothetical protein n=1 Tax=Minwuia sp. TaxID=2493630 RepID=UPI003A8D2361
MKKLGVAIIAVAVVLGLAFVTLGDSAPEPIRGMWQSAFGAGGAAVRPNQGFADFRNESVRIEDGFACARFVERAGDEFSDLRRHCLIGEHRSVRVTIYEPVGYDGLTKKVKLTWLDNQRPNARGRNAPRHADREEARAAARKLAQLYLPGHEDELMALFTRQQSGVVSEGPFIAVLSFNDRGGYKQAVIEVRDGNFQALAGSEERQGRPGYQKCLYILSNIPQLDGSQIQGEPVPERNDLYVTYFLNSDKGEKFLCEIHSSGYYRIRVSQKQGQSFEVLAHGNLGGN